MKFVGIDISKLTFNVAVLTQGHYKNNQFTNDVSGFKKCISWLKADSKTTLLCLEATGIYGLALAKFLYHKQLKTVMVNPIKTHAFARMEMMRNKTDKADAQVIARYCQHLWHQQDSEPQLYEPKPANFERLQYLVTRLEQLSKLTTQETNHLESTADPFLARSIKQVISCLSRQIKQTESEISTIVATTPELKNQVELLTSIQGIADKTAWAILAYIGDIQLFSNAKQVTSYAGLNPKLRQSGTSLNSAHLSKIGHSRLRCSLYMPAMSASKHNPRLREIYQRLVAKGKPKKVALVAVMRKLLVLAYGVIKSGQRFDPNYVA